MEPRERILLKANELFNRFGFRRVTMDEIAVSVGMSKKTIYQFFSTKDEIVAAIMDEHISKNICICEQNNLEAENAVHEIFLTMKMLQGLMAELSPTVFEDLEKFHPSVFFKLYEHKYTFIYKKVENNLRRGVREKLYREDIDIDILTRFRIETMFLPFNQTIFPDANQSKVHVGTQLLEHFVYGLCTEEGRRQVEKYKLERTKSM